MACKHFRVSHGSSLISMWRPEAHLHRASSSITSTSNQLPMQQHRHLWCAGTSRTLPVQYVPGEWQGLCGLKGCEDGSIREVATCCWQQHDLLLAT